MSASQCKPRPSLSPPKAHPPRSPTAVKCRRTQQPTMNLAEKITLVFASLIWMSISSGLILLNKYILKDLGFHYPMAVTGLGMVCSSIASIVTIHGLKMVEAKREVSRQMWLTKLLPVGLFMALSLQLGNYAYLELTVAFIQMLKALCPVFTLFALAMARLLVPSMPVVASVLLISFGVLVSSYAETNFSWIGMMAMLGSEAAEAMRLVITQILLVGMKFHPIEGLMYLAPACTLWLASGSLIWELGPMLEQDALSIVRENSLLFLLAGCMGFAVNLCSLWVIQLASGLTLKVLATAKNTILVVIGALFLGEIVTGLQSLGYAITMAGFVWYQCVFVPPNVAMQQAHGKHQAQGYEPVSATECRQPFSDQGKP